MAKDLVTNADDVELVIWPFESSPVRVSADEFTITKEQTINSVSEIGRNTPKGLTKGDITYSFEFTIQGEQLEVMRGLSDDDGDAIPFEMTAQKLANTKSGSVLWDYALQGCLADTEEISATTGETMEISVEGMASGLDKLI